MELKLIVVSCFTNENEIFMAKFLEHLNLWYKFANIGVFHAVWNKHKCQGTSNIILEIPKPVKLGLFTER